MGAHFLRRLLLSLVTLVGVSVLVFSIVRLLPGDAVSMLLNQMGYGGSPSPQDVARMRAQLGLDQPFHVQYVRWVGDVLRGDFGESLFTGRSIGQDLQQRLPVSLELALMAILFTIAVGVPVGVVSALRQDTAIDYAMRSAAIGFLAIPHFWVATMVIVAASILFMWSPPLRFIPFTEDPMGNLGQFVVPAAILGIGRAAGTLRMTRSMTLEVLRQDYIRTAWAKGLTERTVVLRHAVKNSLIPVVSTLGVDIAVLIGGTVIFETIFQLPGVGRYMYDAIIHRDYPAVQATNLVIATGVIFINLAVDVSYSFLDPKVRY